MHTLFRKLELNDPLGTKLCIGNLCVGIKTLLFSTLKGTEGRVVVRPSAPQNRPLRKILSSATAASTPSAS